LHGPPSGPEYPFLHWQFSKSVLAIKETEFTGQAEQMAEPTVFLYKFTLHALHWPPSSPVNPILHLQSVKSVLVLFEMLFAGHAEQAAEPTVFL
jgi:hypothetical protein